jgi:ribosomal protein S18 acetylase RimI-like enzyme
LQNAGSNECRVPSPAVGADYELLGAFDAADRLQGYACFGPTPGSDRAYDLYWIAVDPSAHGAGIGTLLLTSVERRLAERGARLLVVETSSRSDYAPTRGFYQRRGYQEAARVSGFYAPGDDRIIFTKRVNHSPAGRGA